MSEESRAVNAFFRSASRSDVERVTADILLSERQDKIFSMFYLKRHDVNFIADALCVSADTVNKELREIRRRLLPAL